MSYNFYYVTTRYQARIVQKRCYQFLWVVLRSLCMHSPELYCQIDVNLFLGVPSVVSGVMVSLAEDEDELDNELVALWVSRRFVEDDRPVGL